MVKRNILALQRVLLLLMTRACRTTSTVALQVIAGTKPMELELIEHVLVKRIKRNMNTTWEGNYYRENGTFSRNAECGDRKNNTIHNA